MHHHPRQSNPAIFQNHTYWVYSWIDLQVCHEFYGAKLGDMKIC